MFDAITTKTDAAPRALSAAQLRTVAALVADGLAAVGLVWVTADKVEAATYSGANDPGQWSPGALAIIHTETVCSGLQSFPGWLDTWTQISEACEAALGFPCYFESINQAVAGLYYSFPFTGPTEEAMSEEAIDAALGLGVEVKDDRLADVTGWRAAFLG